MDFIELRMSGDGSVSAETHYFCVSTRQEKNPTDEDWEAFEAIARQWGLERGANCVDLLVVGPDGERHLSKSRFWIDRPAPAALASVPLTTKHEFYAAYEALSSYVRLATDISQGDAKCSKTNTAETLFEFQQKLDAAVKLVDAMDEMLEAQP